MNRAVAVAAVATMAICGGSEAAIPSEARTIIRQVHEAASKRNFAALRALMVDDFQWSFGGDRDAAQALDAWKGDATTLPSLVRVTSRACAFTAKDMIECPLGAGTRARAGFQRTPAGWRMHYFVAGD